VNLFPNLQGDPVASAEALSILLKVAHSQILIIGEDVRAEEWACYVAELGAEVRLIAPRPSESFPLETPSMNSITVVRRPFEEEDLLTCDWLVVTFKDYDACKSIAQKAQRLHLNCAFPCFPELGNFVIPRTYDFESFQILLPHNPGDPQLNKRMSLGGVRCLSTDFSRTLQLINSFETKMREEIEDRGQHSRVLESLFDSSFPELVRAGRWEDAEVLSSKLLLSYAQDHNRKQRASPRVGVILEVQYTAENQSLRGKIFNLSRDGAFIATSNTLPKLTHITAIEFTLPTQEVIRNAEGVVVWENSTDQPRAPLYPSGFAVMFESLTHESLHTIEQYVLSQLK
jgi:siroheme synthase (precorrin-2 oxidase/ferrochelatase)